MADILCTGETIVDIICRPVSSISLSGDYTFPEQITLKTGGDALNNTIDLATIGNSVAYSGRISTDMCGEFIYKTCVEAGVDMSRVVRTNTPQSLTVILMDEKRNRSILCHNANSKEYCLGDFPFDLLSEIKILQLSSTFHMLGFDGELGAVEVLRRAKEAGVITSMDITHDHYNRWDKVIHPCYPYLDYFLPSEEQSALVSGEKNVEKMADYYLNNGVRNVIIKLGSKGSFFKNKDIAFYAGCHDVDVVDATGAGDAFVAGFLSGVVRNMSMENCVRIATSASAHVIQHIGANAGIQPFDIIKKFSEEQPISVCYI